ncbi:DUF2461 domain-containing protein [Neotamlana sedimentorum]|uniref:DUF2461 domain-containing protein n=1 Tax=Neotamlana sedimentorum TaxID=1435349 RepID=UPI00069BB8DA|nr:DUF2461 domain-containing protein [Tamlana sedimentorum]
MITQDYIAFFKSLEKNNNKEWFHKHKKAYENDVKKPFLELLEILIPEIEKLEPQISPNPKDALFRINRDIRFSNDKTPYHVLLKAGFSPNGKKSKLPGFYLGISADKIHVGGGLFNLKGTDLKNVRTLITKNTDEFIQLVNSEFFISTFQELKGEQAKRLDKNFQPILSKTPYIANKQFYAMREFPLIGYLNSDKMFATIINSFKAITPLNQFLKRAFI